jgi:transcriptional antiterminator NusG
VSSDPKETADLLSLPPGEPGAASPAPPAESGTVSDVSQTAAPAPDEIPDVTPAAGAAVAPGAAAVSPDGAPMSEDLAAAEEPDDQEMPPEEEDDDADVTPLELLTDEIRDEDIVKDWYILKVQVNREESIRDALQRRVKIEGLERFFGDIIVPTEDVAEFSKSGKRRIVKRKLYPGYIMVHLAINDDTWFLVRETPGIGDFTGSAGKPTPMDRREVDRILSLGAAEVSGDAHVKTAIPFRAGDRVRVKEGYFQNFEGDVESVDEANGRVTVMINIFGRSTPVELEHWQIEAV